MLNTEAIQSELTSNESLLWQGQPERSVIFHREDILAIPSSLLWGGFTLFWEMMALNIGRFHNNHFSWFLALWGIPFVVVGQYMIWGRFVVAYWTKARTLYAVTSKRILICTMKGDGKSISPLELANIGAVEKSVRSSGIGTLKFAYLQLPEAGGFRVAFGAKKSSGLSGSFQLQKEGAPAFIDILDAEMVYKIIMEAKERQTADQAKVATFGFSRGS